MADNDDTPTLPAFISRADAKAAGLKRYFTGKPCKHGHVAEHYVRGECVACSEIRKAAYLAANRGKINEKRNARYAADPEKGRAASAKFRRDHPDKVKASQAKWNAKNQEHVKQYRSKYHAANADRIRERHAAWLEANRDRVKEYVRTRYWADPEKYREQSRKYIAENPERVLARAEREKKRAHDAAWRAANPEKVREKERAYAAAYYAANSERIIAAATAWRAANPEKARQINRVTKARYRARRREAEGHHTADDIQRIYEAQNGKCAYCKAKVGDSYHIDHIQPLSRGGSNWPANLQILCPACNSSKHNRDPLEHARRLGLLL